MITIYNIGYQGRQIEAFCLALAQVKVEALVDVRAAAWSQRPQFRKGYLQRALEAHNIEYVHCKVAGNPFRPKRGDTFDWTTCEKMYRGHLKENPTVIDAVEALVTAKTSALLCYEAAREECHRGVLLTQLRRRRRDIQIIDL